MAREEVTLAAWLFTCCEIIFNSGDLKGVFDKLHLFWTDQHATIQSTVAKQQKAPKHSANVPLFAAILKQVHGYALERILKELKRLPAVLFLCVPAQFNSQWAFLATTHSTRESSALVWFTLKIYMHTGTILGQSQVLFLRQLCLF